MFVGIISLTISLLPRHLTWTKKPVLSLVSLDTEASIWECLSATVEPFLLLLGTLLEEDLPEDVLLLLVTVIVLYIVVVRLVEN